MFREMRRQKQALTEAECIELLKTETRGVLSVTGDGGYPYGVPINHFYCEEDGRLYFHGGKIGHRVDAVRENPKVSYCVFDKGYRREGEWALNVKSVVIFGKMEIVEDYAKTVEISRALCYKFTDDEKYIREEIEHFGKATLLMALDIEHMTGKLVNEA